MIRQAMRAAFMMIPGLIVLLVGTAQMPAQSSESKKPKRPAVGDRAPDFELSSIDDKKVKLSSLIHDGPVVVVVLRGYPGYQCPLCTKQVAELLKSADKFKDAKTNLLLIYPGPADGLKKHADEFVHGKKLPGNFHLLLDPEFQFTTAYELRWNAPGETAYPSTFVVGTDEEIRFAKVSKSHGDRASAAEILKAVEKK